MQSPRSRLPPRGRMSMHCLAGKMCASCVLLQVVLRLMYRQRLRCRARAASSAPRQLHHRDLPPSPLHSSLPGVLATKPRSRGRMASSGVSSSSCLCLCLSLPSSLCATPPLLLLQRTGRHCPSSRTGSSVRGCRTPSELALASLTAAGEGGGMSRLPPPPEPTPAEW